MSSRRRRAARRRIKQNKGTTGSFSTGEPVFLAVGRLQRPHGLRGELLMTVLTDFPERLTPEQQLYLGEEHQPILIRSVRGHTKGLLIAFEGYAARQDVENLRNQMVYVRADDRPMLPEGEYYHHQLLGLRVVTDDQRELGVLAQILETGANDVYLVRAEDGGEVLLPATDEVILAIDLENKELRVHLLPGLLGG